MPAVHVDRFPILLKLNRLQWSGECEGDCECPAHQDQKNSLHITVAGNKLLLRCLAGCEVPSIIRALGENRYTVLFAQSEPRDGRVSRTKTKSNSKIVATYDYTDADGRLVHQTVRFEPKGFRQRRPASEGDTEGRTTAKRDRDGRWWLWTLKGITPQLYRLPQLLTSDVSEWTFLVEGERDADNAAETFGIVTTTNPMGASKWNSSYSEHFRDRRVAIIPDIDGDGLDCPGMKHARLVAASLQCVAADVRIVELPALGLEPKWDVSDWIEKGGSRGMLFEAVENVEPFEASTGQASDIENAVSDLETIRPLPMDEIVDRISAATDGWPRRAGGVLFAHERERIFWLERTPALFGWLGHRVHRPPKFHRAIGCHSKDEVFSRLQQSVKSYEAVESIPHVPRLEDVYYTCTEVKPGGPEALDRFLDFFSPATVIDRDLMLALLATLIWGGPGGQRPLFLITSDFGRGSGKTMVATFFAQLFGGTIDTESSGDINQFKSRLLSQEGLSKRVVLLDNLKSHRLSSPDLEALVTAPMVSGKRLYVGEGSRPNTLTYLLTVNGASLSRDMAQRSVVIKLDRPVNTGSWHEQLSDHISQHREAIFAGLAGFLTKAAGTLSRYGRWSRWENAILSRLPEPEDAMRTITERQERNSSGSHRLRTRSWCLE